MSGGGNNPPVKKPVPAAPAHELQYRNFQASMPGMQGLLAEQLAAGYGGTPEDFQGLLSALYQDMKTPIINGSADIKALAASNKKAGLGGTNSDDHPWGVDPGADQVQKMPKYSTILDDPYFARRFG